MIHERLIRPEVRLLNLIGPPGIGKTRLAIAAAADLISLFPDGVFFISLGSLTCEGELEAAIARGLQIEETAADTALDVVKARLCEKRTLLVLDSSGQLISAGPRIADLLASCPALNIVVTSRAPLHLRWEHQYRVPALRLPDLERLPGTRALRNCPAIALFVDRAQAVHPEYSLGEHNAVSVAELCVHLDGVPLAIELAAAQCDAFQPRDILKHLRERRLDALSADTLDMPNRHQTLRKAIAWEWDLPDPMERRVFQRLAVFAGNITLEAARAVCGEGPDENIDVARILMGLLRKSLLLAEISPSGESLFRLLTMVREFGHERLAASGEEERARYLHANYFLALAETANSCDIPIAATREQAAVASEYDNISAALQWFKQRGEWEQALRLSAALVRYWWEHRLFHEGRSQFEEALEMANGSGRTVALARARTGLGMFTSLTGDPIGGQLLFARGIELSRESGHGTEVAGAMVMMGVSLASTLGDRAAGRRLLEEGLLLYRELNHMIGISSTLRALVDVATLEEDYQMAYCLTEEALAIAQSMKAESCIVALHINLGLVLLQLGDWRRARSVLEEAITRTLESKRLDETARALESIALLITRTESPDWQRTVRLAGAAARLHAGHPTPRLLDPLRPMVERMLGTARRTLTVQAFAAAWEEGLDMQPDQSVAHALSEPTKPRIPSNERNHSAAVPLLTRREQEVAALIVLGFTNRQIAKELLISEGTVANHLEHIREKLGFRSRAQIAAWAVGEGLIGTEG